jgi:hypothetical protein
MSDSETEAKRNCTAVLPLSVSLRWLPVARCFSILKDCGRVSLKRRRRQKPRDADEKRRLPPFKAYYTEHSVSRNMFTVDLA